MENCLSPADLQQLTETILDLSFFSTFLGVVIGLFIAPYAYAFGLWLWQCFEKRRSDSSKGWN